MKRSLLLLVCFCASLGAFAQKPASWSSSDILLGLKKLKDKLLKFINCSNVYDQEYKSEYQSLLVKLENSNQTNSPSVGSNP